MERRRFIVKAGGTLAAVGATAIVDAPYVIAQPKVQWRINTIADYKGLKMRIPGLGGQVVAKAGGTVVLTPGSEIYAALERGVIDASEWIGPHFEAKNTIAVEKLKTEFKGKVEILQLPAPVMRDLKKLAAEVVKEESEKSPMARKVYASYTRFQTQLAAWSHISEGAYQQFVAPRGG